MWKISTISDDWVTKGFHLHVGAVEIAMRPDHQHGFIFAKVFRITTDSDFQEKVKQAENVLKPRPSNGISMNPTLNHFLQGGAIGEVAIGCSEKYLFDQWGKPDNESVRDNPRILKYGTLELAFLKNRAETEASLKSINLIFDPDLAWPTFSVFSEIWASPSTTEREFRNHLELSGVQVHSRVESDSHIHLILPKGVKVTFENDFLQRMSYRSARQPEGKQVSTTVFDTDLKAIRELATQLGISVSTLCSRWINEAVQRGNRSTHVSIGRRRSPLAN